MKFENKPYGTACSVSTIHERLKENKRGSLGQHKYPEWHFTQSPSPGLFVAPPLVHCCLWQRCPLRANWVVWSHYLSPILALRQGSELCIILRGRGDDSLDLLS